ncbi:MAG: porin family protein [Pseudomonadota bacterium]|nr:porin family protein [Pseudomonadota bacterium]
MLRSVSLASLSIFALAAGASAQEGQFKLGAGYERADFDDVELDTAVLRGGYDFNRYFGVEGQAHIGIGDESVSVGGLTGDVSMDYSLGAFGVVRPWSNEQANVFLRGGYTTTEADADVAGLGFDANEDAWAFGVGGEWYFAGDNGVRVDYTRYDYDDGGDADFYGISYVRRFGG